MPIIDLNKVVGVWQDNDIRNWGFHEKIELMRMLTASIERDYEEYRKVLWNSFA